MIQEIKNNVIKGAAVRIKTSKGLALVAMQYREPATNKARYKCDIYKHCHKLDTLYFFSADEMIQSISRRYQLKAISAIISA